MYSSPYNFDAQMAAREIRRLSEQQEKIPQGYNLFSSMMRNDEQHRENLWNLEETLRCARQHHWYGMGHCFELYRKAESQRLGARLRLMEDNGIEIYSSNPNNAREHELFKELLLLLNTFYETACERHHNLVRKHNEHPTNETRANVYQHRSNMDICKNLFAWLLRYYGLTEEAAQVEQAKLPELVKVQPEPAQAELWEGTR